MHPGIKVPSVGASRIVRRKIKVGKRPIYLSLEVEFWTGFKEIARLEGLTLAQLLQTIMTEHGSNTVSSAVRVYVLEHFRTLARRRGAIIG
jgi:predicted DNA-binding ribbon-helix-helix protein